jgi:hypothetical protein
MHSSTMDAGKLFQPVRNSSGSTFSDTRMKQPFLIWVLDNRYEQLL